MTAMKNLKLNLVMIWLLFFTSVASAHLLCVDVMGQKTADELLAGPEKINEIMRLFFFSAKGHTGALNLTREPNLYFEMLWRNQNFQDHLKKNNLQPASAKVTFQKKYQLIASYLHQYLAQYRDSTQLMKRQEEEALHGLERHGLHIHEGETAAEARRRNSAENLTRLMLMYDLQKHEALNPEIEATANQLELFLAHNSHIMEKPPGYPVIAPTEIDKLGLIRFAASTWKFNRLLGSDHFVYFRSLFRRQGTQSHPKSEYGSNGVIVSKSYAEEQALISPYVMYPSELYYSVKQINPKAAQELLGQIAEVSGDSITFVQSHDRLDGPEQIQAAQKNLHQLDFTPSDFELLVKAVLKKSLYKQLEENPVEYKKTIEKLQNADLNKLNATVHSIFQRVIAYDNHLGFEGVIPVAVPEQHLEHF